MTHPHGPEDAALERERTELLEQLDAWLETPMAILGFAWLALLIVELTRGVSPLLATATTIIWIVFILDFMLKLALAPRKGAYLRRSWLTVLSLAVPALRVVKIARVVRVLRLARATRGLRLLRVVSSLNRGMRALGAAMGRRGFGYAVALTLVVTLAGAAGMFAFERDAEGARGLPSYGDALWWTAMIMTTMGSEYWPQTPEGRALCVLLALYAFAVFGYVTAALASFFVGRDAERDDAEVAGGRVLAELRAEVAALRAELAPLARERVQ
jgi:voltage-gated potassium channel